MTTPRPARIAVRDGLRDGSAPAAGQPRPCPACQATLPSARARYCSAACKQRAYRLRQAPPSVPAPGSPGTRCSHPASARSPLIYECPGCETRLLGQQRCPDCQLFCRRLGPGGPCPHCDELLLVAELLGKEAAP